MNITSIAKALGKRRVSYSTATSVKPAAVFDAAKKREIILHFLNRLGETAFVDDRGNEKPESKEIRKYLSKIDKSKLTDADINELVVGLREIFLDDIKAKSRA